jgi:CRISPR system Cascade subunit CasD
MLILVFNLQAPMAAWGEVAVGERRGSWTRPGKTAVLGLVAAALGHRREDGAAHADLHAGLGYAVRVNDPGRPLRDYHTAQAPSAKRNVRWETRRDELSAPRHELNTILSERRYYVEPDVDIALWRRAESPGPSLQAIADALQRPVFSLFLGRKACPPGRSLSPRLVEADDIPTAFAANDAGKPKADGLPKRRVHAFDGPPEIWSDLDAGLAFDPVEVVRRRDGLRDRPRWLFSDRLEGRLRSAEAEP